MSASTQTDDGPGEPAETWEDVVARIAEDGANPRDATEGKKAIDTFNQKVSERNGRVEALKFALPALKEAHTKALVALYNAGREAIFDAYASGPGKRVSVGDARIISELDSSQKTDVETYENAFETELEAIDRVNMNNHAIKSVGSLRERIARIGEEVEQLDGQILAETEPSDKTDLTWQKNAKLAQTTMLEIAKTEEELAATSTGKKDAKLEKLDKFGQKLRGHFNSSVAEFEISAILKSTLQSSFVTLYEKASAVIKGGNNVYITDEEPRLISRAGSGELNNAEIEYNKAVVAFRAAVAAIRAPAPISAESSTEGAGAATTTTTVTPVTTPKGSVPKAGTVPKADSETSTPKPTPKAKSESPKVSGDTRKSTKTATPTGQDDGYDYSFKISIVGDSGVGKSSLILRYADNTFTESYISTIGVDFKVKKLEIGGKIVKLMIYDTAGQERYRTIASSLFRNMNAIIAAYDVGDSESFKHVVGESRDGPRPWLNEIDRYAKRDTPTFLVGTKIDRYDQSDANDNSNAEERAVTFDEANKAAHALGLPYFETSAKKGTNVEKLFETVAKQLVASAKEAELAARSKPKEDVVDTVNEKTIERKVATVGTPFRQTAPTPDTSSTPSRRFDFFTLIEPSTRELTEPPKPKEAPATQAFDPNNFWYYGPVGTNGFSKADDEKHFRYSRGLEKVPATNPWIPQARGKDLR